MTTFIPNGTNRTTRSSLRFIPRSTSCCWSNFYPACCYVGPTDSPDATTGRDKNYNPRGRKGCSRSIPIQYVLQRTSFPENELSSGDEPFPGNEPPPASERSGRSESFLGSEPFPATDGSRYVLRSSPPTLRFVYLFCFCFVLFDSSWVLSRGRESGIAYLSNQLLD